MAADKIIIDRAKLTAIAEALRAKLNSSDTFTADEIAQEIENYTLDATATADAIRVGYTAYSKNEKIDGNIEDYLFETEDGAEVDVDTRLKETIEGTLTRLDDDSITALRGYIFNSDTNLEYVNLPNCISVGSNVFTKASSLVEVHLPKLSDLLGGSVFGNCSSLKIVDLPNVSRVSASSIFSNCTSLEYINLPNITGTGLGFLKGCTMLAEVDFGSKIANIGSGTFSECKSLKTLIIRSNTVPSVQSNFLDGAIHYSGEIDDVYNPLGLKDGYIYVVDDIYESEYDEEGNLIKQGYLDATNWSVYKSQIRKLSELESQGE